MDTPTNKSSGIRTFVKNHTTPIACWLMLISVFLIHFSFVAKYAFDLPFWDDWFYFPVDANLSWIFDFHNEHRTPFVKLLVMILYNLNGWNIAQNQILNFIIYGGIVLFIAFTISNWVPGWKKWMSAAFCTILLSPVVSENHLWAIAISYHLYIFFMFIAVTFLFMKRSNISTMCLRSLSLMCLIFTMASGLVASLTLLCIWTLFHLSEGYARKESTRTMTIQWVIVSIPVLLSVIFYMKGYAPPANHAAPVHPWTLQFWQHLGGIIQLGFAGSRKITILWPTFGVISLAILCGIPLFIIGKRHLQKGFVLPVGLWRLTAVAAAFFAGMCLTSYGRGNFSLPSALPGRYAELSIIFIPLGAASWYWAMEKSPALRNSLVFLLFIGTAVAHGRMAGQLHYYKQYSKNRTQELTVINSHYASPSGKPVVFWDQVSLNPQLEQAKMLKISFYQKMVAARSKYP